MMMVNNKDVLIPHIWLLMDEEVSLKNKTTVYSVFIGRWRSNLE